MTRLRLTLFYRALSAFIAFSFLSSLILPPGYAQLIPQTLLNLPAPGTMVAPTAGFIPPRLIGVTIHADNPLKFDFIVNTGDADLAPETLKEESRKLIKYFLASLTVPEDELWVNLSPYENDRMVPQGLGQTEMGRDMLAQDYLLKQLTASLMYPEKELGKAFWDKVYKKAYEEYGTTEIPVNTFNKVWIVPEQAVVYERGDTAFVVKSRLKVMLESDYEALQHASKIEDGGWKGEDRSSNLDSQSSIIKEVILPAIEKEVNEGENFAKLRQMYHSLILAAWYKQKFVGTGRDLSLLGKVYVDQNKTKGIETEDKQVNQKIYDQYIESFKKGVYNYIREDYDPATDDVIPRKYFSGGIGFNASPEKKGAPGGFQGIVAMVAAGLIIGGTLAQPAEAQEFFHHVEETGKNNRIEVVLGENPVKSAEETLAALEPSLDVVQPILLAQATKDKEKLKGPVSTKELMEMAEKAYGIETFEAVIDQLVKRNDPGTVDFLKKSYNQELPENALMDVNWRKRFVIVKAIGEIGRESDIWFLEERVSGGFFVSQELDERVRTAAREAIKRIKERLDLKLKEKLKGLVSTKELMEMAEKAYDIEVFEAVIEQLVKRNDPGTVDFLKKLYKQEFPENALMDVKWRKRFVIVKAIGEIGRESDIRFLEEVSGGFFLSREGDGRVITAAREAIERIKERLDLELKEKLKGPASSPVLKGEEVDLEGMAFRGEVLIENQSGQRVELARMGGEFFPRTPDGRPLIEDTRVLIVKEKDMVTAGAASPIVSSPTGRKLTNVVLAFATAGMICVSGCPGPTTPSTTPPIETNMGEPISIRDVLNWMRSQQDSRTGLVESYDNTTDSILSNQASTYDQALAVITNIQGGDIESATKIMDFFVQNWDNTHGFVNFYVTSTGRPGIQKALLKHQGSRVHSGPNLWIGMAAIALYEATGDVQYFNLAVDVASWTAKVVPHDANGGIAMGPEDDVAPWTKIYSTEHNLDYAAVLQKLLAKQDKLTTAEKDLFEAERTGVKRWIKARYNPGTGILDRGLNDATKALDSTTLFILTFGPQAIQDEFGIDPDQLIAKAEEYFGVTVAVPGIQGTVSGFDFTDPDFRGPVIWFEGTGQMAAVYEVMAKWHETLGNDKMAANYRAKKDFYKTQIDKVKRVYPDGREAVPYASERAKTFSDGWYTPSNGPDGKLAVSVSGSSWRVISDGTYNPMVAKEKVASSPVVGEEEKDRTESKDPFYISLFENIKKFKELIREYGNFLASRNKREYEGDLQEEEKQIRILLWQTFSIIKGSLRFDTRHILSMKEDELNSLNEQMHSVLEEFSDLFLKFSKFDRLDSVSISDETGVWLWNFYHLINNTYKRFNKLLVEVARHPLTNKKIKELIIKLYARGNDGRIYTIKSPEAAELFFNNENYNRYLKHYVVTSHIDRFDTKAVLEQILTRWGEERNYKGIALHIVAPEGGKSLFFHIPVPYGIEDWLMDVNSEEALRDQVVSFYEELNSQVSSPAIKQGQGAGVKGQEIASDEQRGTSDEDASSPVPGVDLVKLAYDTFLFKSTRRDSSYNNHIVIVEEKEELRVAISEGDNDRLRNILDAIGDFVLELTSTSINGSIYKDGTSIIMDLPILKPKQDLTGKIEEIDQWQKEINSQLRDLGGVIEHKWASKGGTFYDIFHEVTFSLKLPAASSPMKQEVRLKLKDDGYAHLGPDSQGVMWANQALDLSDSSTQENILQLFRLAGLDSSWKGQQLSLIVGEKTVGDQKVFTVPAMAVDNGQNIKFIQFLSRPFDYDYYMGLISTRLMRHVFFDGDIFYVAAKVKFDTLPSGGVDFVIQPSEPASSPLQTLPTDQWMPDENSAKTGRELTAKLLKVTREITLVWELSGRDVFVVNEIQLRESPRVIFAAISEFERKMPDEDISQATGEALIRWLYQRGVLAYREGSEVKPAFWSVREEDLEEIKRLFREQILAWHAQDVKELKSLETFSWEGIKTYFTMDSEAAAMRKRFSKLEKIFAEKQNRWPTNQELEDLLSALSKEEGEEGEAAKLFLISAVMNDFIDDASVKFIKRLFKGPASSPVVEKMLREYWESGEKQPLSIQEIVDRTGLEKEWILSSIGTINSDPTNPLWIEPAGLHKKLDKETMWIRVMEKPQPWPLPASSDIPGVSKRVRGERPASSPVSGQHRLIGAITALSLLWGMSTPAADALEMSLWKKFDEPTERARMINEIALGIINLGDEQTGLAPSHLGHPGFEKLKFVYDAAVDALVLKAAGRQKEAEKILDYFADRLAIPLQDVVPYADTNGIAGILKVWQTDKFNVRGLINALDRTSMKPRGQGMLEYYSTPGPMAFIVMAFLNVNKERYLPVAVELGNALLSLQRPNGGLKDGDRSPNRVHIEPHMDSFAAFFQLYQATNDKKWKTAAEKAWQFFIKSDAYHPQDGIIWQGVWEFGTNKVFATDAYSWTMAGPGGDRMSLYELEKFTETMLAKSLTLVTLEVPDGKTKSVILVDFTDPQNPQVVKERGGFHPMGSVEWAGGVIAALQKNAVRFWEKGNPQQKEKARHYKALAEYLIANSLYAFYEIPGLEGMLSFYATGQNVETGHGWRTPFFYVKGPGVTIKGGSLVSAWPVLPIQGLNPFDRQDPYKKSYDAIPISGEDKERALQFVALSVVNRSFKEAVPTKGPDAATQIVEPGNYNLQMWNAFVRGDYKKSIEWAQKVVNDPDWIRLARRDQEQKAKEIGGLVRYPWGTPSDQVPKEHQTIWRYPLLNEMGAAMWGLAAANFELGNTKESKKWMRRIIEEIPYHQIAAGHWEEKEVIDPVTGKKIINPVTGEVKTERYFVVTGYWNALISWEYNPGGVRRDAQMGVLYREVLREIGLRSAAPKEISVQGLKFAPSVLDMQDKPKSQEAPAPQPIPGQGPQKGMERGDLQTDKEVMSYLEQINIVDPGTAKRSRPFQAIVKMGQRAEATLVRVIKNHELQGDPLKWAAYLLGVVGSYEVAKPVLENVIESSSYPWYVQVEARNGLDVLEERFQKQEPKKKPSKGDVGIEQTVLSYLKQLTIPDPTAAKNSRAFREIVALGRKAEPTLVRVIENHELAGDPLKWAAYLLGVVGSYEVAKPILERVIHDPSYPWYVQEEAKNGLQILLRRKAAGQAGLKEDDLKTLEFAEAGPASSPVGEVKEFSRSLPQDEMANVLGMIRAISAAQNLEGNQEDVQLTKTLKYYGGQGTFENGYRVSFAGEMILDQSDTRYKFRYEPRIFPVNDKPPIHFTTDTIYLEIPGDGEQIFKFKIKDERRPTEGFRVSRISREQFEMEKAFSVPRDLEDVGRLAEEINRLAHGFGINGDVVQERDGSLYLVNPQGFSNRSFNRTLTFHLGIWKRDSRNPAVQKAAADLLRKMGIEPSGVTPQGEQGVASGERRLSGEAERASPSTSSGSLDKESRVKSRDISAKTEATSDEFKKGGIDLNPALLDLQIKRDGNGIPLPLPQQPIENMHIEGFIPIIINVTPISNLPLLLGLADTGQDTEETVPAMKAREPEEVSALN